MKPDALGPFTRTPFGFYDPQGPKQLQVLLEINKNVRTALTELEH